MLQKYYYGEPEKRWNAILHRLRFHPDLWGEDDTKAERIKRLKAKVSRHVWLWEKGRIGAWCVYVDSPKACNVLSRHYHKKEAEQAMRNLIRRHPHAKHRFFVAWRPASADVHPVPLRDRLITPPLD